MHGIVRNGDLREVVKDDWGDNTCVSLFHAENGIYTEVLKNDNTHLAEMSDYKENMRWVREGVGRNAWFRLAVYPRDKEKIRAYHREAWIDIFGDEPPSDSAVDQKAKRILRKNPASIAFGYCPDGEIGMIETDDDISLYPSAGHISLLYLKPQFRRKGYGIQLIGHAMNNYKEKGKKHLSVRVAETNTSAYSFYKKYGFYEAFRETEGMFNQIIMVLDI